MTSSTTPLPSPASAAHCRELIEAAHDLGVPRDYGRTRKLRRVREPSHLESIGLDTQGREQFLAPRAAR
ncbi:MAG: hypothetical protein ACYC9P_11695, partial [Rudaea sp.]